MKNVTKPQHGYIRVVCSVKYFFFIDKHIYKNFHLVAKFPEKDANFNAKLSYWKSCSFGENGTECPYRHNSAPPNVLLLGMDSTSRLNFHRFMSKSVQVLKEIGAIEMVGYTKGLATL